MQSFVALQAVACFLFPNRVPKVPVVSLAFLGQLEFVESWVTG